MMYQGSVDNSREYTFIEALVAGVDPGGGDIVPVGITPIPMPFFNNICEMTPQEIAYVVASKLMESDFTSEQLRLLVDEWIDGISIGIAPAGVNVYAVESLDGDTMSEYDLAARLFALVARHMYDRGLITVDTLFFAPSKADSCAAMTHALKSVIGQSPIIVQTMGTLSNLERRQLVSLTPEPMRNAVNCDEHSLEKLVRRAMSLPGFFNSHIPIAMAAFNVVTLVARVVTWFIAFREMSLNKKEGTVSIVMDEADLSACNAARVAVSLGLPVSLVKARMMSREIDRFIKEAYLAEGYILCPRSASLWNAARERVADDPSLSAMFVQSNHPAKNRTFLEPLLNKVIPLPHKLYYGEDRYNKPRRLAPSIASLKTCLANY